MNKVGKMKDMLAWLVATFYQIISVSDRPSLSSPSEKNNTLRYTKLDHRPRLTLTTERLHQPVILLDWSKLPRDFKQRQPRRKHGKPCTLNQPLTFPFLAFVHWKIVHQME